MRNNVEKMSIIDFKDEIAIRLKLDLTKDIFDLVDEVSNIINEKRQILEICEEKQISLNRLETNDLEDTKHIICYYTEAIEKEKEGENETNDDRTYVVFDNYYAAKEYYDKCITKTMKDWHESKIGSFDQFCKPGDIVGQDIVDEFVNSLPPVTQHSNFVQTGEPYSHELDKEDNKFKATYTTFEKEQGNWVYKGNCFKNKNMDVYLTNEKNGIDIKDNFYIAVNLEDFDGDRLLLQSNETVASIEKDSYFIAVDVNGEVNIFDKKGKHIPLYDEKLKQSIYDGTFDKKYEIKNNNWLELSYFKKNEQDEYEYMECNNDVFFSIYELGNSKDEIRNYLEESLNEFIKENEEEEVRE